MDHDDDDWWNISRHVEIDPLLQVGEIIDNLDHIHTLAEYAFTNMREDLMRIPISFPLCDWIPTADGDFIRVEVSHYSWKRKDYQYYTVHMGSYDRLNERVLIDDRFMNIKKDTHSLRLAIDHMLNNTIPLHNVDKDIDYAKHYYALNWEDR